MNTTNHDAPSRQEYSVSALNAAARRLLEENYSGIRLRGEVSRITRSSAGHVYLTIKDDKAAIDCVLFRSSWMRVEKKFTTAKLEAGTDVILTGRLSLYEARGSYQFSVSDMEPVVGKGDLYLAFEKLKSELAEKGYFDAENKKKLPAHPKAVGIVTSATGAAIEDIKQVFERRNPTIKLVIYPVLVQGASAARQIAQAIRKANERNQENLLIVGRGGGSIEDLWAFNEKVVADAIFASELPVISGIGHQSDVSIADFVADVSAATPTAAAELVTTPSLQDILDQLSRCESALLAAISRKLEILAQRADYAERGLTHPRQRIETLTVKFDRFESRLREICEQLARQRQHAVEQQAQRLRAASPVQNMLVLQQKLDSLEHRLNIHTRDFLARAETRLQVQESSLNSLNPRSVMQRGYSILRRQDDQSVVRKIEGVAPGEKITALVTDGSIQCSVESISE